VTAYKFSQYDKYRMRFLVSIGVYHPWASEDTIMKASGFIAAAFFGGLTTGAFAGDVSVVVTGVIPNGTRVYVALCANNLETSSCTTGDRKVAQASTVRFLFSNVTPSRYAILAFQDLNGSGQLERSKLGIPLEPFALSNEAGRTGKPSFEAAAVPIGVGGGEFQLALRSIGHRSGQ